MSQFALGYERVACERGHATHRKGRQPTGNQQKVKVVSLAASMTKACGLTQGTWPS